MPATTVRSPDIGLDDPSEISALLHAAVDGDQSAWAEIVATYGRLVSATVRSYRLQDADAFDAIQTTWLRLLTHGRRIQDPERLGGWLVTTARRECLAILRRSKRVTYRDETFDTIADSSASPEQRFLAGEEIRTVRGLVADLPARGRTLLEALFSDNPQPYSEIASTMEIPIGSVGPTRARALRQLRRMLHERELECVLAG
jgi:RNA polymerase sigma factor (sigma-70 family)